MNLVVPVLPVPKLDETSMRELRSANFRRLNNSRQIGPELRANLTDVTGIVPGSTQTFHISPLTTVIGADSKEGRDIINKYGLIIDGGKKKSRRRRSTKKKKRRRRKRNLKKRTKRRRRSKRRRRR